MKKVNLKELITMIKQNIQNIDVEVENHWFTKQQN